MKIMFIDESINRVGGVERIISTLSNRLVINNDVDVVSIYKSSENPFYSYNSKINIKYLIDSQNYKSMKLKRKNILYYFYRFFEKLKDKFIKNSKIKEIIGDFDNYDVIVFGRVFPTLDFLKNLDKKSNKYKIIVRDAINLKYYSNKHKKAIYKLFPKYVDTFIVSSDESIKAYQEFFLDSQIRFTKIYNPLGIVPTVKYDFDSKTVVSLGRYDEQKGFDTLIYAFSKVLTTHPDWKLEIYGNGNYEAQLKNIIDKLNVGDNVFLKPAVKDIVKVLNKSAIFVLPSRYEGYANALVESLSCGIPSITFDWYMGANEIIENDKNGIIVPLKNRDDYFNGAVVEDDINSLKNAINKLIENPKLCELFSNNGKEIINSRTIDVIIKKWEELI